MIIQSLLEAGQDLSLRVLKPSMDVKIQTYRATCVKIVMSLIGTTMREELLRFRHGELPRRRHLLHLARRLRAATTAPDLQILMQEVQKVVRKLPVPASLWKPPGRREQPQGGPGLQVLRNLPHQKLSARVLAVPLQEKQVEARMEPRMPVQKTSGRRVSRDSSQTTQRYGAPRSTRSDHCTHSSKL